MNRQTMIAIAAVITTLADTGGGSPESILYLGIGADLGKWENLKGLLYNADLITCQGHYVTITAAGRTLSEKIKAAAGLPS